MTHITPKPNKERTMLIDQTGTTTYIGVAKLGTLTADTKWQIKRIALSGTVLSFQFADGDRRFNNSWDDRASLTYVN